MLHLAWKDDRPTPDVPTELPGNDFVITIEVGPALDYDPRRLRELVRPGSSGGESCGDWTTHAPSEVVRETLRTEGDAASQNVPGVRSTVSR